ncbi:MAG: hypothetical protein SFU56_17025 [Capsulimonadales bacterium]|nr:hypothetical protein [Capsulimonadales bacterium]
MVERKPKTTRKPKPLTDPADLLRLGGRFFGTLILYVISFSYLIKQDYPGAAAMALLAIALQIWTIRLWRYLRDQRVAARAAQAESGVQVGVAEAGR